jgi:hypothetical protein
MIIFYLCTFDNWCYSSIYPGDCWTFFIVKICYFIKLNTLFNLFISSNVHSVLKKVESCSTRKAKSYSKLQKLLTSCQAQSISKGLESNYFILFYYIKYNIIIVTFLFSNMFSALKNWGRPLQVWQFFSLRPPPIHFSPTATPLPLLMTGP